MEPQWSGPPLSVNDNKVQLDRIVAYPVAPTHNFMTPLAARSEQFEEDTSYRCYKLRIPRQRQRGRLVAILV